MTSFYTEEELQELGFAHVGKNVLLSRKTSIYGAKNIWIGNHVRIDDFCVLSGKMTFDGYNHIAAYSAIFGGPAGVEFRKFSALSSHGSIYATSDDYSGGGMTNPMIPDEYKNMQNKPVCIGEHVVVGSSCVILPGVTIGDGCSVGAMSLVNRSLEPWGMYMGVPAKRLRERKKDLLELAEKFMEEESRKE